MPYSNLHVLAWNSGLTVASNVAVVVVCPETPSDSISGASAVDVVNCSTGPTVGLPSSFDCAFSARTR